MSVTVGELYATLKLDQSAFNKGLHSSGSVLGSFAKAAVATGVVVAGSLTLALDKAVHSADEFGKTSAKVAAVTGLAIGPASTLVAVFNKFGIEGDAVVKSIAMLTKNIGTNAKSADAAKKFYKDWGFSLVDAKGHVKDANQVILDAADFFNRKNIPATQRAALEAKLFGKSWQTMIPILSLGSKGIKEAQQAAADLGLELNAQNAGQLAAYRESQRKMGEAWAAFGLSLGLFVMPIVTAFGNLMSGTVIPALRHVATGVMAWISANAPLIASIGGFVGTVFSLARAVGGTLLDAFGKIAKVVGPIIAGAFKIATIAINLFLHGTAPLGDRLATIGRLFLAWIGPIVAKIVPALSDLAKRVITWIGSQVPVWAAQLRLWADAFIAWIGPLIPPALAKLGELAGRVVTWIRGQIPVWANQLRTWADAFIAWVAPMIPPALVALGELGTKVVKWIADQIPGFVTQLVAWGGAFVDWVAPKIPEMLGGLASLATALTDWIAQQAPTVLADALDLGGKLIDGIVGALVKLPGAIADWVNTMDPSKIGTNLVNVLKDATILLAVGTAGTAVGAAFSAAFSAGAAAVEALVSLLGGALGAIQGAMQSVVEAVGAGIGVAFSAAFEVGATALDAMAAAIKGALAAHLPEMIEAVAPIGAAVGSAMDAAIIAGIAGGGLLIAAAIADVLKKAIGPLDINLGLFPGKTPVPSGGGGGSSPSPTPPPTPGGGETGAGGIVGPGGPLRFAVGAWNLPRDMLGFLHAGEMIIPATIADRVRAGAGGSGGGGSSGGDHSVSVSGNTFVLQGVGSDVSSSAARRFGQAVLDEVARGLREQTARTAS